MRAAGGASAERGSAYLLAVTVLLALTGLGIVLSEIALMERRLGTADRELLQALNAADSGLAIASARILAGEALEEQDIVYGRSWWAGLTLSSRARIAAPVLIAVDPCESCQPEGEWAKVSYGISATGERQIRSPLAGPDLARSAARVALGATVTLQPWPAPGRAVTPGAGDEPASTCAPEVEERLYQGLARELHPPGCRFGGRHFVVQMLDAKTGLICGVRLPVCLLLTDWREE